MDSTFYTQNREHVFENIKNNSILVMYSGIAPNKSADEAYPFTPNRNFYYLTGLHRENFVLLANKQNDTVQTTLYIEKPDPFAEKWTGYKMTSEEARTISGIEDVRYVDGFTVDLARLLQTGHYQYAHLDMERRDWDTTVTAPGSELAVSLRNKYPYLQIENLYPVVSQMRTLKSTPEVDHIRTAIAITQSGIENMLTHAKPNMKEYQLEAHFDFKLGEAGVRDHAFSSIVASGKNATILHYLENDKTVEDGSLVLIDLGAQYKYYNADISRTFPISGKFTDRQRTLYEIVLKAQMETLAIIMPGLPFKSLNEKTKQVLTEELLKIGLIEQSEQISQYYYHGVSHYLGLDTHDVGVYDGVLEPGMVITMEPGLYIAEEGIGIRIEDDILITETGHENLSAAIPKTVDEIEQLMARG